MHGMYRWAVVFAGMTMLGCAEARQSDVGAEGDQGLFRPATSMDVSATEYRVAPPDKLLIRVPGIKELEFTTTIRPDGKIQLNLLGEMYVAGKTPDEISRMITAAAAKYYNNVGVQVEVAEFNSKFYAVFGTAVREGGRRPFTGRNTVIAALASVGFTEDAWPQQIAISRPAKNGQIRATAIIDMKTMYMTGDTRQNYLLEEGDIIHVPDSPLAVFEKKARQFLGPITGVGGAASSAASYGTSPK
jgi:protein involved in polysaccharide export with SLBB domain